MDQEAAPLSPATARLVEALGEVLAAAAQLRFTTAHETPALDQVAAALDQLAGAVERAREAVKDVRRSRPGGA